MVLWLIGLGLADERDITLRGLDAVKGCERVYLEAYTSMLPGVDVARLEELYGKPVVVADRELVESAADVERAVRVLDAAGATAVPVHALIESPAAVHRAFDIAAHPRVQSLSFGLMDFVSAHGGAIPGDAMGAQGQFTHPLVVRAKLEIASACHAQGKAPSHGVVTEFKDKAALAAAARRAARELGFTRMWSIHPDQIRVLLEAFAPDARDIDTAASIILAAARADWAPISHAGKLEDRASYRYHWQVLERAHQTGRKLPPETLGWFQPPVT